MNLSTIAFPRQLEPDNAAEMIRKALMAHTTRLRRESRIDIPVVELSDALKKALWRARLQSRVRLGLDDIFEKLAGEKRGIDLVLQKAGTPSGNRISRLIFFSNDGAERFYRQIEQTLVDHAPRILGCQLDIDGNALGSFITGKSGIIKIMMIEHKDAVSDVLRAIIAKNTQSAVPRFPMTVLSFMSLLFFNIQITVFSSPQILDTIYPVWYPL